MLRKCLLFGAALAIMGSNAGAADITPVPEAFDWTGAYIGLSAGYMWGKVDYREPEFPGFGVNETDGSFIGGAYLGFNYQMDSIALGAEVDGNLGGVDIDNDEDAEFNSYSAFDSDWNAHLRARIGFAADRALFYAAGGLAIADLTVDDTDDGFGKDTNTYFGWTIWRRRRICDDRRSADTRRISL